MGEMFPTGHFYSAVPDFDSITEDAYRSGLYKYLAGIDMNAEAQMQLAEELSVMLSSGHIWKQERTQGLNYFSNPPNTLYNLSDALILSSIIRKYQSKRIVEIGAGYSTACMVDVSKHYLNSSLEITCIEPDVSRLKEVLGEDISLIHLHEKPVQEISIDIFDKLQQSDILFIDSTHVSKFGSDINRIFFEILPRLKDGVIIHFHDVFYPFEYPHRWLKDGISWTEAYLLRAFLMYNHKFEIMFFTDYLNKTMRDEYLKWFPIFLGHSGGNIWIRKK